MNPVDRTYLQTLLWRRDREPTAWDLVWARRTLYLFMIVFGVGVGWFLDQDLPGTFLFYGAVVGMIGRDVIHCLHSAAAWPTTREVIDWKEVERRVAETKGP
jgi:hypothetical protein